MRERANVADEHSDTETIRRQHEDLKDPRADSDLRRQLVVGTVTAIAGAAATFVFTLVVDALR